MKAGDVINGYTLLEDFKVVGAGLSQWTFAERGGRQFFLKQFLSPTYPDDAAPGSPKTKAKKRARCAAFESHHRGIQLVLVKSVAHSLKILHDLRIVHSDLKPSNILVKRTELGYTSKLIDFDSSYIAGNPPPFDQIVGTINYYSPELLGYIQEAGVPAKDLGVASDIFALGLIFTEFLTGAMPPFDVARYHEAAVAIRHGETLLIPRTGVPPELADLIDTMLLA